MYNQAKYGEVDIITGDYLAGIETPPISFRSQAS